MPEYYDGPPRKRPRKRSQSSSPIDRDPDHLSPRRKSYREDDGKYRRRDARESSGSPPRNRKHGSRSREEDHGRRLNHDGFAESTSRVRRRGGDTREEHGFTSRHRADSHSPPPKRRPRNSFSPPPRDRRHGSYSPRPSDHRHNSRTQDRKSYRKRSPHRRDEPSSNTPALSKRSNGPLPSQEAAFTKNSNSPKDLMSKSDAQAEKQKPNYAPSGLLAAETNTVANTKIVLKYNEPPESRLPPSSQPWRLYVFKNKDLLDTIPLHTRPCWLFGRETAVCDVAVEHPSASKQHAVLQFRYLEKSVGEFGEKKGKVGLYILDLDSANGTKLNGEALPGRRFVECMSGDMVQFGESTREYVVLLPPKE